MRHTQNSHNFARAWTPESTMSRRKRVCLYVFVLPAACHAASRAACYLRRSLPMLRALCGARVSACPCFPFDTGAHRSPTTCRRQRPQRRLLLLLLRERLRSRMVLPLRTSLLLPLAPRRHSVQCPTRSPPRHGRKHLPRRQQSQSLSRFRPTSPLLGQPCLQHRRPRSRSHRLPTQLLRRPRLPRRAAAPAAASMRSWRTCSGSCRRRVRRWTR